MEPFIAAAAAAVGAVKDKISHVTSSGSWPEPCKAAMVGSVESQGSDRISNLAGIMEKQNKIAEALVTAKSVFITTIHYACL